MRLGLVSFLGVALIFLFIVLQLVSGADYLAAFKQGELDAQVTLLLDAFNYAWLIGLVCFGIHLMLLGYLMLASAAPRVLSILLWVAGAAYVFDTLANALLPNYAAYTTVFLLIAVVPSVVGELAFSVWLLARGGMQQQALR